MTDAASAPGLDDVWNLVLAFAVRQPIQLRVLIVLVALLAVVLMIDGIRANVRRAKPGSLVIVRTPFEPARALRPRTTMAARQPIQTFKVKQASRKLSPHKALRPTINRVPPGNPQNDASDQSIASSREGDGTPL